MEHDPPPTGDIPDEPAATPSGDLIQQNDANFAANMRRIRERDECTKAELVRRLQGLGWANAHQTTLSRIENCERSVRLGEARLIAHALRTSVDALAEPPQIAYAEEEVAWRLNELQASHNSIVMDVGQLTRNRQELDRVLAAVKSGRMLLADGSVIELYMTDRLAELIEQVESLADVTVDDAVTRGKDGADFRFPDSRRGRPRQRADAALQAALQATEDGSQ